MMELELGFRCRKWPIVSEMLVKNMIFQCTKRNFPKFSLKRGWMCVWLKTFTLISDFILKQSCNCVLHYSYWKLLFLYQCKLRLGHGTWESWYMGSDFVAFFTRICVLKIARCRPGRCVCTGRFYCILNEDSIIDLPVGWMFMNPTFSSACNETYTIEHAHHHARKF
jgi:hypothetical protein